VTTAGAETNVPLLVAVVFAATFLVVGALAYLFLFRQTAPGPPSPASPRRPADMTVPPATSAADVAHEPSPQFTLPLDGPAAEPPHPPTWESVSVSAAPQVTAGADQSHPEQRMLLRLYRALMFATGVAGLLASALMFSAVDGFSLLPIAALLVLAFSLYSIYRGFVPDAELRRRQ
jgi:hypothetical protein